MGTDRVGAGVVSGGGGGRGVSKCINTACCKSEIEQGPERSRGTNTQGS